MAAPPFDGLGSDDSSVGAEHSQRRCLVGVGLVAENLFAAALGDEVGLAGQGGEGLAEILPEEDAAAVGPLEAEGYGVFEDGWGVGEEGAVPEVGAAAFEDVDGLVFAAGAMKIEAEGAGALVFAVDDDDVVGLEFRGDGFGELVRREYRGEDLQAGVGGQQEGEGCGGEPEISGVRFVVAAAEPVGEGSGEECYCGEEQRAAEGSHGLGVEIEKVPEGEGVVAGVLFEERGEVGAGAGRLSVQDEESGDEGSEGAEDEERDGDALAGADEWVGDDEGFGFDGFGVEPCGDEEHHSGECGQDVVLLAGGEREEEERDDRPEAEEEAGALVLVESADGDERTEGFAPGDGGRAAEE